MWTSEFAQPGTLPTAGLSNTSAGGSSLVWFAASSLLGRVRHGRLLLAALTGVPTSSGAGQSCLTTWHGECSWGTVPSRLRPQLSAAQWPMPCQLSARILAAAWRGRWARCANFFRLGHAAWCTLTNVNMALGGRRPRLLLVGTLAPLPTSWPRGASLAAVSALPQGCLTFSFRERCRLQHQLDCAGRRLPS